MTTTLKVNLHPVFHKVAGCANAKRAFREADGQKKIEDGVAFNQWMFDYCIANEWSWQPEGKVTFVYRATESFDGHYEITFEHESDAMMFKLCVDGVTTP